MSFFGNMTCFHSGEHKGKTHLLRLKNAGEPQQTASPYMWWLHSYMHRGQEGT